MNPYLSPAPPTHQRGVVLIIALIILLALTIIGVSGMSTTTMQEHMSANMRDRQVAFQAAEAALRDGERYIQNNIPNSINTTSLFDTNCTNGLCACYDNTVGCVQYWTDPVVNVWQTANRHRTYATPYTQVAVQPEYIIEFMGWVLQPGDQANAIPSASNGDPMMFRITALGTGQTPNATVMLQSTYKKN